VPASSDALYATLCRSLLNLADRTRAIRDASLEGIADLIVDEARQLMSDVECVLSVVSEQHPENFTVIAGAGAWAKSTVGGEWPVAGTLNGRALLTQQTVDTDDAPSESSTPHVFGEQIRVGRLVPILGSHPLPDGRTVLGVLGFWRASTRFSTDECAVIDAFASYASLQVVGLEARRASGVIGDRLAFAHRVSLDLQASLVPSDIVQRLLMTTLSIVHADRATLSTIEDDVITIEATLGGGGQPTWVGRRYGNEFFTLQPEVGAAVRERRPVLGGALNVENAAPEFRTALAKTKHTLTLPLVIADKTVGLLVLSRVDDKPFTDQDLEVMELIGSIAALALRNARQFEQIHQAGQAKSEFLNMAAHELRTPITVVQGYLDLIRTGAFGDLPDAVTSPVDLIAGKAAELGSLVTNILDAARLQAAPPVLPSSVFDLREEVAEAVKRAEARRALLEGTLLYEPPPGPIEVEAGRGYIGRVLDNLINNAMAYQAEKPWIHITLTAEADAAISVADHGLGIPEDVQPRIFDQFFRVGRPPWNQAAGTGLGLFLSKQFARTAGGDLRLEISELGVGTTFVFLLPLADSAAPRS
jgi:signal transduction histidine kinase